MGKARIPVHDIGEISQKSGLRPSTLRYYEELGLIRSAGRQGLRRIYDIRVLEHLAFIALGQLAGFSLREIKAMFVADGKFHIDRRQLTRKADELSKTIERMTAIREGLSHAADCRAPTHMECPKFQRLLRVAGRTHARVRVKSRSHRDT